MVLRISAFVALAAAFWVGVIALHTLFQRAIQREAPVQMLPPPPAPPPAETRIEPAPQRPAWACAPLDPEEEQRRRATFDGASGPISKRAVVLGMRSVRPEICACYDRYAQPGLAMVNVVIARSGRIASAKVTGKFAGTATGACVERAVRSARFPRSDGLTTPYPFMLR